MYSMQISKIAACRSGRKRVGISLGRMVGVAGIEPATSSLSGTRSNQLSYTPGCVGGGNGTRTRDIQLAKLALYQLSYAPGGLTGTGHGPFARTPASQKSMHGLLRSRSGEAHISAACGVVCPGTNPEPSGRSRMIVRIFRLRASPFAGDSP